MCRPSEASLLTVWNHRAIEGASEKEEAVVTKVVCVF